MEPSMEARWMRTLNRVVEMKKEENDGRGEEEEKNSTYVTIGELDTDDWSSVTNSLSDSSQGMDVMNDLDRKKQNG